MSTPTLAADAERLVAEVPDPELPHVTLGDLGVIRAVNVRGQGVEVVVTPTYTACPATEMICGQIVETLAAHGIDAEVTLTLTPPWSTDWITERGRERLRSAGIAPPPTGVTDDLEAVLDLPVACPRCGSHRTRRHSDFGATACKSMYSCEACREPFERFKPI
ncbi:MAG: 1,2-phenylacetyl-CoA epoxidase subunit PaaD [Actinomycetota bacterium]